MYAIVYKLMICLTVFTASPSCYAQTLNCVLTILHMLFISIYRLTVFHVMHRPMAMYVCHLLHAYVTVYLPAYSLMKTKCLMYLVEMSELNSVNQSRLV